MIDSNFLIFLIFCRGEGEVFPNCGTHLAGAALPAADTQ